MSRSAVIKADTRSTTRVLKAGSVETVDRHRTVMAAEAERAEQDRRAELAAAFEAGREQGRAEGIAETERAGVAAVLRATEAIETVSATLNAHESGAYSVTSDAILAAAVEVAEWVLRRELSTDGQALLGRLSEAAADLLPSPTTRIAVSPADHPLVLEWAQRRGRVGTDVVADGRLAPGDAVITTDAGLAEVTVAAALQTAAQALGLTDPLLGSSS